MARWAQGCLLSTLAIRAFARALLIGVATSSGRPVGPVEVSELWFSVEKVRFPWCNQHMIQI